MDLLRQFVISGTIKHLHKPIKSFWVTGYAFFPYLADSSQELTNSSQGAFIQAEIPIG